MAAVMLNVGSGQRKFKGNGWVNLDIVSRPPDQVPDVIADARALPYEDSTAQMVVLHHCLEHFHLGEGDGIVREAHRVLAPGGSLLVFVPDLKALAQRWLTRQVDDFIFTVNLYGAWQGREGDDHHWGWSQNGLIEYLYKCFPWRLIRGFDWRPIAGADLARSWWVASAECIK